MLADCVIAEVSIVDCSGLVVDGALLVVVISLVVPEALALSITFEVSKVLLDIENVEDKVLEYFEIVFVDSSCLVSLDLTICAVFIVIKRMHT